MDWSKTKTIFIIVFSILNLFLYSLYVNRQTESQNVQVLGGSMPIEESLRLDNITYGELPVHNKEISYMSAKIIAFTPEMVGQLQNQSITIIDGTQLNAHLEVPISVRSEKGDFHFSEFLLNFVLNGDEYIQWEVDEDRQQAVFFQKVADKPIYFNENAMLKLHWNEKGEVTNYEQRMFGELESFNRKKDLLTPLQAIHTLSSKGSIKQDSKVLKMTLGYSTLVQISKTQVFAPTWHVHVELKDGGIADYFINANEGKIIEFQREQIEHDIE